MWNDVGGEGISTEGMIGILGASKGTTVTGWGVWMVDMGMHLKVLDVAVYTFIRSL